MNAVEDLIKETITALRAQKSQNWVSQNLGFSYNIVSRWESGQRAISWSEFLDFCKLVKVDIKSSIELLFRGEDFNPKTIFNKLARDKSTDTICEILKCSRSTYYRLKKGEQDPSLGSILSLIYYNGDITRFYGSFMEHAHEIPTLNKEMERTRKARELFSLEPLVSPILLYLETESYLKLKKHSAKKISERFHLKEERIDSLFNKLQELDLVSLQNHKYTPTSPFLNLGWSKERDLKDLNKIEHYWVNLAEGSFKEDSKVNREAISFFVFNANEEIVKKVKAKAKDFYNEVHHLLDSEDGPVDSQCVMNCQLLMFKD